MFAAPATCQCKSGFYFDSSADKCVACDPLCSECYGGSASECYSCNSALGYSVEGKTNLCVSSCSDLEGYFKSGSACKRKVDM